MFLLTCLLFLGAASRGYLALLYFQNTVAVVGNMHKLERFVLSEGLKFIILNILFRHRTA